MPPLFFSLQTMHSTSFPKKKKATHSPRHTNKTDFISPAAMIPQNPEGNERRKSGQSRSRTDVKPLFAALRQRPGPSSSIAWILI